MKVKGGVMEAGRVWLEKKETDGEDQEGNVICNRGVRKDWDDIRGKGKDYRCIEAGPSHPKSPLHDDCKDKKSRGG